MPSGRDEGGGGTKMSITKDPAAIVYLVTAVAVALHMVLLDAYSGLVRAKTKTVVNPEDLRVTRNTTVVDEDPPAVARVLRAHRNLVANGVPFLVLGLLWVLTGATWTWALALFGTFFAARLVHSIAYVAEKQPWRTAAFVVGQLALAGLTFALLRNALA
jgi:prostaglandin-E synthase 1